MFVNSPAGSFDLRGERGAFARQRGGTNSAVDVFVTDAREPADAMREFIRLTGAPVMPPKWALGYMQSHRTLSTEADLLAEAQKFRDDQLPCDTFILLGTGFSPAGLEPRPRFVSIQHERFRARRVHGDSGIALESSARRASRRSACSAIIRRFTGKFRPRRARTLDQHDIGNYWKRHDEPCRRRRGRLVAG